MAAVGKRGTKADINVVPLIDVVLVLLIIFMVITPLLIKEMDVQVPEKAEVETPDQLPKDQVVLSLQSDRTIFINKEQVPIDELADRLERIFNGRSKTDRVLFIDVADTVAYGDAMVLMDIARGAGAEKIGIVEEHKDMAAAGMAPALPEP